MPWIHFASTTALLLLGTSILLPPDSKLENRLKMIKPGGMQGTGGLKQPLVHDVEADPHPKADERLGEATPQVC